MATRFIHFRLVGPAVLVLALLIAGLAAIPYVGASRLDAELRERQETLVKRNIAIWTADIEFALTAWTIWDESIAKLDNAFDQEWADRNIGQSLIGTSRTRFAGVIDSSDRLIYSRTGDDVKTRPFFQRDGQAAINDAAILIGKVRAKEREPRMSGIPDPIAFSRIEVFGSEAVLLTASLFQPDFGTASPRTSRAPILVTAMPIGTSLQEFFGERFLLDDAEVGSLASVRPGRASVAIAVGADGETEVLSWQPQMPARDLLQQTLPLIVIVTLVLIAGGYFAVQNSRRFLSALLRAEQQMRHAATHDFLTGLANRSLVEAEFSRYRTKGGLVVTCLDLDGFKGVNDTLGHAAGDELLREVARKLRTGTRRHDLVFRLGGDEFAILMPETDVGEAERICRHLSIALSTPVALSGTIVKVGASFGLCEVARHSDASCDDALRKADSALYEAKALGRGNVIIAGAPARGASDQKDTERSGAVA